MIARIFSILLPGLLALVLVSCGDDVRADAPPKINHGHDVCDRCHMIISEERYSSGLVGEDGEKRIFDDAGEMVAFMQENPGIYDDWRVWVHDYDSVKWIDGKTAHYVHSMHAITPMGSGVLAFESRHHADEHAEQHGGTVMNWQTLLSSFQMPMHPH